MPPFAAQNRANTPEADAVLSCKHATGNDERPVSVANLLHLLAGQFGLGDAFTAGLASLLLLVLIVVCRGAEKEMVRANARRIVAAMKHTHIIGNFTIGQFPRDAMGLARTVVDGYLAVAAGVGSGLPQPAGIGFVNLAPEAFGKWPNVCSAARHAAKLAAPSSEMSRAGEECGRTLQTDAGDSWGILTGHRKLLSGVTPSAVTAARGSFACLHYTTQQRFYGIGKG